jgi:hypothetical protein
MGELTAEDVSNFTGGRLANDNGLGEITAMLNAAVRVARRDAGWHVSPIREAQTVTLDGPDSRILWLPTRKVTTLNSVTENGVELDLTKLTWSPGGDVGVLERPAVIRKKSGGFWSSDYQSIVVDMDHGYTEEEAVDWRRAVLTMVDQMSLVPVTGGGFSGAALKTKRVDDVSYGWDNSYVMMAENTLYSVDYVLADYRLPRVEFI